MKAVVAVLLSLGGLILAAVWSVSSPVGSSADEDFHLTSIWCAWGESETCVTENRNGEMAFLVPDQISGESCFLRGYKEASLNSAACLLGREAGDDLVATQRLNEVAGYYPPFFYRALRVFVSDQPEFSVLSMRLFNGALAVMMIGAAVILSQPWVRRSIIAGLTGTLVPFGLFFVPSVNPSSWVIIGVSTFWVFFLSWLTTPRLLSGRSVALVLFGLLALGLATTSRSDGALFVATSVLMTVLIAWKKVKVNRSRLLVLLIPIPLILWSLSFRFGGLTQLFLIDYKTQTSESGSAALGALAANFFRYGLEIPALLAGTLGANAPAFAQAEVFLYGIGSVDVRMPAILYLLTSALTISLVFTGLRTLTLAKGIALTIGALVILAVPLLTIARVGFQFAYSPRYIYPFVIVLVSLAMLARPWRLLALSRAQCWALGLGFGLANSIALLTTIRRYTNGQADTWASIAFHPDWWWAWGPHPLWLVFLGSIAGFTVGAGFAVLLERPNLRFSHPTVGLS